MDEIDLAVEKARRRKRNQKNVQRKKKRLAEIKRRSLTYYKRAVAAEGTVISLGVSLLVFMAITGFLITTLLKGR